MKSDRVEVSFVMPCLNEEQTLPQCIAKATKRWSFPKPPTASSVLVSYPFVLTPA